MVLTAVYQLVALAMPYDEDWYDTVLAALAIPYYRGCYGIEFTI